MESEIYRIESESSVFRLRVRTPHMWRSHSRFGQSQRTEEFFDLVGGVRMPFARLISAMPNVVSSYALPARISVTLSAIIFAARPISSSVVYSPTLNLTAPRARSRGTPIAVRTDDGSF